MILEKTQQQTDAKRSLILRRLTQFFGGDFAILGISLELESMTRIQITRSFLLVSFWGVTFLSDVFLFLLWIILIGAYTYVFPILGISVFFVSVVVVYMLLQRFHRWQSFAHAGGFVVGVLYASTQLLTHFFFPQHQALFASLGKNFFFAIGIFIMTPYFLFPLFRAMLFLIIELLYLIPMKPHTFRFIHDSFIKTASTLYVAVAFFTTMFVVYAPGNFTNQLLRSQQLNNVFEYVLIGIGLVSPLIRFSDKTHKK